MVRRTRERALGARGADNLGHLLAFGRDDDPISHVHLGHTRPDSDDERGAGEEAERLSREANRREAGWDHRKSSHARSGRAAAKFTPRKLLE
jgi:hypothetical protein